MNALIAIKSVESELNKLLYSTHLQSIVFLAHLYDFTVSCDSDLYREIASCFIRADNVTHHTSVTTNCLKKSLSDISSFERAVLKRILKTARLVYATMARLP